MECTRPAHVDVANISKCTVYMYSSTLLLFGVEDQVGLTAQLIFEYTDEVYI